MSRKQATVLAILGTLGGLGLLAYVFVVVSPYDETGQLSALALLLFFAGLFLLAGGVSTLLALAAHKRWPALAGRAAQKRAGKPPAADAALRQGILAGLVVAILLALSILRVLDVTFFLVALLLAGLVEAYAQTRR